MKLRLEWSRPIPLRRARQRTLVYTTDLDKLPDGPGLYVFGRQYGNSLEALYVGKAKNIRSRVDRQLNNSRLIQHMRTAKIGKRILLVGRFVPKPGQRESDCLPLLERALIRPFVSDGHDLVNIQGTRLRQHEIRSAGKHPRRFVPTLMFLEKT